MQSSVEVDVLRRESHLFHVVEAHDRTEGLERMGEALLFEDAQLVVHSRVAERRPQEEAVELRLGQREGPFVLDRVLRREQQERARQLPRDAVRRYLPLGHCLEQRGLRLGCRPVDLVDENDVGEDRPRPELEVPRLLVEHGEPGHVGGLQVGGALDARGSRSLAGY